ncbi:hypothetical protein Tco_0453205 [Tanacetum coccineum]
MASQDARLSKFKADFKQQQSEMTNKINTFLKAINDRMTGALASDPVKNPKLNVNPTSSVLYTRSYPIEDPHSSSRPLNSINAIKSINEIGTPNPKEPGQTFEDEFKDLHLNLPVLEVLAHAPIYNANLDKYVEILELGKNGSAFIQDEMPKKIKDLELFTLPCRLRDSKPFDTLADLGSYGTKSYLVGIVKNVEVHIGKLKLLEDFYVIDMEKDLATPLLVVRGFLATASAVIDSKKAKIAVEEGITSTDGIGSRPLYYVTKDFMDYHFPGEWEIARDAKLNPFKDVLVFRKTVEFLGAIPINLKGNMWELEELIEKRIDWNRPPKEGDGAWHIRIELINLDGEKINKTFQSIPTTRKLSEKENPNKIIDLDHFHNS